MRNHKTRSSFYVLEWNIVFVGIFVIVTFASLWFSPVFSYDILKIKTVNLVKDQNDFFHLIGLIQNIGNKTLNQVFVTGNFLNKNGISISNYSKQIEIPTLNPNGISPFDILVFDKRHNNDIKNYSLGFEYNFTRYSEKKIQIISSNSRLDVTGIYFINGKIKNIGYTTSNKTTIIAAVYDDKNRLMGIWRAQTEPYDILPSKMASFSIPVTDKIQSFKIKNYSLFY